MSKNTLVEVEGISKRFCRDLKKSLWYGVQDIACELCAVNRPSSQLRKSEFWALDDVSFSVKPGECVAMIGPNGAGKSTMLKLLNGLMKPDAGRIEISGQVGALIELGAGFNPLLSGRENIYVNASVLGLNKKQVDSRLDEIVEFADIGDFIDSPVRTYSSGMRVRLAFSVAAHLRPDLLIVDEVLAVGDVGFRMKCFKHILNLVDSGTSVIIVSHNLSDLSRVSERAIVFGQGRKIFDGQLGEGVVEYEKLLARELRDEECASMVKRAQIESVQVLDNNGIPKERFSTGETIRIRVQLKANSPLRGAQIFAGLDSVSLGRLGSISTPLTGFSFDVEPPTTVLDVHLKDIPLLTGRYLLSLSLCGSDITDFQDRLTPACHFEVVLPPDHAYGQSVSNSIRFQHQWELVNIQPSDKRY